mmetsp:Transcript_4118/g.7873  ORF Transcript_4118/g.7873 Transcript_4118/m.7873 type:complete len:128 (+) Transcript_4118:30-413(+)
MAQRSAVLGGYRRLLRASRELFAGDRVALASSRVELRKNFLKHESETDPKVLQQLLTDIDEVETMMRENMLQAKLNERGNYEVELKVVPTEPGSTCPPKFEPKPVDLEEIAKRERELAVEAEDSKLK